MTRREGEGSGECLADGPSSDGRVDSGTATAATTSSEAGKLVLEKCSPYPAPDGVGSPRIPRTLEGFLRLKMSGMTMA